MNDLITEALKLCGFSSSDDSIQALKNWAIAHMVDHEDELIYLELNDWLTTIGIADPEILLPEYMYFMPGIPDRVISALHKGLKVKKLTATKREVHELAFYADEINENLDRIKDLNHAINYVLLIFKTGRWETPYGFEEQFKFYATKRPELMAPEKKQSHYVDNTVIH